MKRILNTLLDIVYPIRCGFCGGIVEYGNETALCDDCRSKLESTFNIRQRKDGFSLYEYKDEIRRSILSFKYDGRKELGKVFGFLMYEAFKENGTSLDFDCIVPVPISEKRFEARGYNQTELIALSLSGLSSIPVEKGLIRIKETLPQSELNYKERQTNVKDAFGTKHLFKGKRILLLDDIYTTGSTMRECRKALYNAGAEKVYCCTVAYTVMEDD